ncbi:GerAB/ArcD/ProY family transporter [Alicyclobacillus dauci]|uniref:Spore germination protein n=1 Tax=Alicyclobacillus dauci TaxID=1475485 RepID=A0ABY6YYW8_9BACL|nr:endospore germination permease [Alicyclobacillus dauci]WAH35649.1 spore germination protein [Alicyclobacillus dauci]
MARTRSEITVMEAASIIASTIIGVGVLELPRIAVVAGDTGAPLYVFLAILLSFVALYVVTILGIRFPGDTIVQYSERVLGKWLARIGSLFVVVFFAILTALAAREFAEVVGTSVLQQTPVEATTIVMLFLGALFTRNSLSTFSYTHFFYLPLIVAPACLIAGFSLKNATALNLQPIFGNEPAHALTGILTVAALFQGSFIMTFVIPYMREPKKAVASSIIGMSIAGGVYFFIATASLAVFGSEEIKLLLWPTLELAKTTMLPGEILERLDAAFLAVWVTAVFTTIYGTYYVTSKTLQDLFKLRDQKMFSFGLLTFIFILAMMPTNIINLYRIIAMVGQRGLFVTLGYPILIWLVAIIRRQRNDERGRSYVDGR